MANKSNQTEGSLAPQQIPECHLKSSTEQIDKNALGNLLKDLSFHITILCFKSHYSIFRKFPKSKH